MQRLIQHIIHGIAVLISIAVVSTICFGWVALVCFRMSQELETYPFLSPRNVTVTLFASWLIFMGISLWIHATLQIITAYLTFANAENERKRR